MGAAELALRREVGCLHDERIAFPSTASVAVPLADLVREMGAPVERDDAGVVGHLTEDDDVARGLEDVLIAVVAGTDLGDTEVRTSMSQW